ncbi:hypothetical protein Tsubulata_019399 [Turnera subulata]|uniref:RRM domain-containing protein n=1 Tax=Turnera subulata TaxID=218843 RepID=A0A9Q0F5K5_9ROSI|nr:hypothetical protein Tsubulata_019399 [Turnera subulata]
MLSTLLCSPFSPKPHLPPLPCSPISPGLPPPRHPPPPATFELHCILSKYGEVVDIYIPAKRTKNGKRFGFARFRACYDTQKLMTSNNLIKVGNGHLQSLFAHDRTRPQPRDPPQKPKTNIIYPPPPPSAPSKTFAETVKGSIKHPPTTQNVNPDRANISFSPLQCEIEWLPSCAFAVFSEPIEPLLVFRLFLKHGHSVMISDLGGDSLLIQFPAPEAKTTVIESNHEWTVNVFDLLRPWRKNDGPSNRKVWIRAKGNPVHAWSTGFFRSLALRFGSLVSIAPETENKSKLDYAFLQAVTTVFKPIRWEITALIEDTPFQISIEELTLPPVPPTTTCYPAPLTCTSVETCHPSLEKSIPKPHQSKNSQPGSPLDQITITKSFVFGDRDK